MNLQLNKEKLSYIQSKFLRKESLFFDSNKFTSDLESIYIEIINILLFTTDMIKKIFMNLFH